MRAPHPASGFLTRCLIVALALVACVASTPAGPRPSQEGQSVRDADDLLVVDCLLPGQVRRLGRNHTYQTPRRPVKTTAVDCEIRGGEYVAYDRADLATSLKVWLPEAQKGDPAAQNYVGEIYEKGLGLPPDYEVAAGWYRRAAEAGDARAQINLGQLYEQGLGVPRDAAKAVEWYRRASGFDELGLEFLPAAAPAAADGPTQEQTQEQLDTLARELETLRTDLERTRSALAEAEAARDRLRTQIERQQEELESRDDSISEGEAALDGLRAELAAQSAGVADKQNEIDGLNNHIESLESRLEEQKERARQPSPARPPIVLAGPTIQIIEPPIVATRGVRVVAVETTVEERLIVGRVDAPAGLLAMTINDAETSIDDSGIFRAQVPVGDEATQVTVVAIDLQGKRAERQLTLQRTQDRPQNGLKPPPAPGLDLGNYVALVIGNNKYQHLPDLATAVNDARTVAGVLEKQYGFSVRLLIDADRYTILDALNDLRASLTEKDNLLIYYAGHGELDQVNQRGNWLPVDAESDSSTNWISTVAISDVLNAAAAQHVLVVADSCYSGALTRAALTRLDPGTTEEAEEAWLRAMLKGRSRTALTSGGLSPVLDSGGGEHSVFARHFLDVLAANREVLAAQQLYREVSARVTYAAESRAFEQVPQYAPIRFAGHESGDFFFAPVSG